MHTADGVCLTMALLAAGVWWYVVVYLGGVAEE